MSEHMVVYVDRLMQPVPSTPVESETPEPSCIMEDNAVDIYEGEKEEDPLVWWGECRICQEESAIKNLESPCSCNGSLKVFFLHCSKKKRKKMLIRKKITNVFGQYAHRKCVQRWCNEKGNTICEICHQVYKASLDSVLIFRSRGRELM